MSIVTHKSGDVNSKFDKISTFFDKFSNEVDNKKNWQIFYCQSIGVSPFFIKKSLHFEKCLQPKNPRYADKGLG